MHMGVLVSKSATSRSADLAGVHPILRERYTRGVALARSEDLYVHCFEAMRTAERQEMLYAQGRSLPGPVVTNARAWESMHQYGLAIDSAFDSDPKTLKVEWTWNGNWRRFGEIMMAEGLIWYGAPGSRFREAPHVQLTGGLTLAEVRALMKTGGLPMVWDTVTQRITGGNPK